MATRTAGPKEYEEIGRLVIDALDKISKAETACLEIQAWTDLDGAAGITGVRAGTPCPSLKTACANTGRPGCLLAALRKFVKKPAPSPHYFTDEEGRKWKWVPVEEKR